MNHETDPNLHPSISETETSAERTEELSIVSMSPETFAALGSTDPKSDEAVSFMEANHLAFNTNIIVLIEGSDQPSVVSTSETDFFTRDRRATAELIAHGVADSAEVEANPMDRTVQSEMGHEALELTAIHVVEGSETDESAEESPVETPEGVTREFIERVSQIETAARNEVNNYNRQAEVTLDSLSRGRQQISPELDSIQYLLNHAMDGSLDFGSAFITIGSQLEHIQGMLTSELSDLHDLAGATERLGVSIDGLKNGELSQQKKAFETTAGDEGGEALQEADGLDQSLRKLSGLLDLTRSVVRNAEEASSTQGTQFNRLLNLVRDDLQPRASYGQLKPDDLDRFVYMIRQTNNEFGDPSNSPVTKINNSIQELRL